MAAWQQALQAPVWDGTCVWIHSDLLPPNLLVDYGRLHAVIDFGGAGLGDPATDLNPAWSLFGDAGRTLFRDILDVDDGTWQRGRGIALHQALGLIPYYAITNPELSALGQRMLGEILADAQAD
jgi:aminoglycoside phosphotransferase (APT) family kinase protein